jgi:hypothetical protein
MNKKAAFAALGLSGMLLCSGASAITLAGGNVSYSFDAAQLGLFGTASLVGGNLALTPTNFLATSSTPAVQTVHITITADAGYTLSALNLSESGGYSMPAGAADQVYLAGNISVLDIEGDTSNKLVSNIQALAPFSGAGGNWAAQAGVVVPASGWGGSDGIVSSVRFTITNQLFALGGGEIWKDAISVMAVTTPVPEAETYAMMLVGLGLVGFMARRRTRLPS